MTPNEFEKNGYILLSQTQAMMTESFDAEHQMNGASSPNQLSQTKAQNQDVQIRIRVIKNGQPYSGKFKLQTTNHKPQTTNHKPQPNPFYNPKLKERITLDKSLLILVVLVNPTWYNCGLSVLVELA